MSRLATASLAVTTMLLTTLACGPQTGMMGPDHMSGRQMMEMMQDPEVMQEWTDEMSRNPAMMGRLMQQMHRHLRQREVEAVGPVRCVTFLL